MNRKPERAANRGHLPPLVARELLVGSRQPRTYWLRLLTALGAVSVLVILIATGHSRLGRTDGFVLFAGSTTVLFFIASLNGLRSTSDCISAERRQGTLTLLFLASLKLNTILVSNHEFLFDHFRRGVLPMLGLDLLMLLLVSLKTARGDGSGWHLAGLLLAQNGLFLSGLWAMGTTGVWLGLKQRSLTRASISLVCYFLLLPALLYFIWPTQAWLVTIVLVLAYGAIALLMHRQLALKLERPDGLQWLLRRET